MPFLVPDFDPGMVASIVHPIGNADHSRRDADRSTCVHQQDGQPGAGSETALHRFGRALGGLLPLGGILHLHQMKESLVEPLRGFSGSLAISHQRSTRLRKSLAPSLPLLVESRVGQDVVEKDLGRNVLAPRRGLDGLVSELEIFQQE